MPNPLSREELDALLHNDDPQAVNSPNDIRARLWAIEQLEAEIDELFELQDEAEFFYNQRVSQKKHAIDFLKTQIEAYLQNTGQTSVPTERGTPVLQEREKIVWPDGDTLMQWCEERGLVEEKVIRKRLSKRKIQHYIEETGEVPPGMKKKTYSFLQVRGRPEPEEDTADEPADEMPY